MTNCNIRNNHLSVLKSLAPGGRGQGEGEARDMPQATTSLRHSCFPPLSFSTSLIENPVSLIFVTARSHRAFFTLSFSTFVIGDPESLSFSQAIRRGYRPVNVEQIFI